MIAIDMNIYCFESYILVLLAENTGLIQQFVPLR
jgi:hypothetical protein